MRYVCLAISALIGCSFVASIHVDGQPPTGLSITNYQFVSEVRWSRTMSYVTYRADLLNTGPTLASATASVTSTAPNVQMVPDQRLLQFGPVPANGQVTSSNTFTIFIDRTVVFDPSVLSWSFLAPHADAGPDQTVAVGSTVTLDGTHSTNPTGAGTLSYQWTITSRPPGGTAQLKNPNSAVATFVADVQGTYVVSLTASNGVNSDTASVNINAGTSAAPVADAGQSQSATVGATVFLDGSKSHDANGKPLTYSWTLIAQPGTSTAVLNGVNTVLPSIKIDAPGIYIASLVVNNGTMSSVPSTVLITTAGAPPVADAGPSQVVSTGITVQVDGSGSTDSSGGPLTYRWSLLSIPTGSQAQLSDPVEVKPTFTVDVAGTYIVQLVVTNAHGQGSAATTLVTTNAILPPVADAGPSQGVPLFSPATLNGTAKDPQGRTLTLNWSLISQPAGSTAQLSSSTVANPSFTPDQPGIYVAQLIANNGVLRSAPSTVMITTGTPLPQANPGPDQNVPLGAVVTLNGSKSTAGLGPLTYSWSLLKSPAGSAAALSKPSSSSPSFTADVAGTYVAQLIVRDSVAQSAPQTVTITAGAPAITLTPSPLNLGVGSAGTLTVNLGEPAGAGGLLVKLASSDPTIATVPSSVPVPAGQSKASVTVNSHAEGSAFIVATVPGFVPGTVTVNVQVANITLTFSSNTVGISATVQGTVTLSNASSASVSVALSASPAGIIGLPPSVLIAANATTQTFTVTGLALGSTIITASASGYTSGSATVTVLKLGTIQLPPNVSVGPNQSATYPVTLVTPAPVGGVKIALTSSDPSTVQIQPSTVSILQGQTQPAPQPSISGLKFGAATITATAPGFSGDTETVTVTAALSFSPNAVTVGVGGNGTLNLTLSAPAPAGLSVKLSSANTAIATVPASVSFPTNATSVPVPVTGVAAGTAVIHASALPSLADTTATVNVALLGKIQIPANLSVAVGESIPVPVTLSAPAPAGGVTITLQLSDVSRATIVPPTLSIPVGKTAPVSAPQLTGVAAGSVSLTATAPAYSPATQTIAITPGISITTASLPDGTVGTAYSSPAMAASGGTAPYKWSASGLPAGLSMNATTGVISGTPTSAGTSTVAVKVTDSGVPAHTGTKNLALTINGPLSITTSALPTAFVGTAYSTTLAATGGKTPYTWTATGLPAGLALDPSSGVISGTPTAPGTSSVVVKVTDATAPLHLTASKTFSLIVTQKTGPLSITTASLPNGVVGKPYTMTLAATGGTTPYSWTATGLPAGLALNPSSGVISGTPTAPGTSSVVVKVTDATAPVHLTASKTFSLIISRTLAITTTSLPEGITGAAYTATVGAIGGVLPYKWSATGLPAGLSINMSTGVISGAPTTPGTSTVTITVNDSSTPTPLKATANLSIKVVAPLSITTTSLPVGVVGTPYSATLNSTGGSTPYFWSASGLPAGLTINSSTGTITGTPSAAGSGTTAVTVKDSSNPAQSVTRSFPFQVVAGFSITTTSLPGGAVGTSYNFTATAIGGTTPYVWSATGLPAGLSINSTTGAIVGTPTAAGTSSVVLTATDSTSPTHLKATRTLPLTILAPVTITTASPLPSGSVGAPYSVTLLAIGGKPPYTWSATGLPAGLIINPSNGIISGTATAATTNTVVVTATDSTTPTHLAGTKSFSLTISGKLTITTASLPPGVALVAYTTSPLAATGGKPPYKWSATGLPTGLAINSATGVISGTPTSAGTTTVAITVKDSTSPTPLTAGANLSLVIVAPLAISTSALPMGVAGMPYNFTPTQTGGLPPYTWSASGLPAGLSINSSTGVISGTPTTLGTYPVILTVTDSMTPKHLTASKTLSLVVVAPLSITTASLPSGLVGSTYGVVVAATGGTKPYTWSATGLPTGLSINPATGAITGTLITAGTSSVELTVKDSTNPNLTATKVLTLTVLAPVAITTTALPKGVAGTAYGPVTVTATGGTPPYTWSATGLPAGLTVNPTTGVITGTPASAGTSSVTFTATDATAPTHLTGTRTLALVVLAPVAITTTSLPEGVVGVGYSAPVLATGGTPPYTWSATGLPAGLSINPTTGIIGGTPSAAGTSTVTLTATDSTSPAHLKASKSLLLVVVPALTITSTSLPTGVAGKPYSAALAASGGTLPYTWSATGLPGGLSLNASTGLISGTPASIGTSAVTITATDSTKPAQKVSKILLLVVAPPLVITTTSLPVGITGTPYGTALAATGGTKPYTWSATGLPAGLTINTSTGAISGTPTATGVSTVSISVSDSTNPAQKATASLTLKVLAPLVISTTSLPTGVVGTAYSSPAAAATGGTTPYTWSATGLPAGLTINSSTGAITGTPTVAGTSTVTLKVTDSTTPAALVTTKTVPLVVVSPLKITTTSLPPGSVDAPYGVALTATGGTTPYSWSATGLPNGISINKSTGALSGTPTTLGTSTVSVTVTDSTKPMQMAKASLSLVIGPPVPANILVVSGGGQQALAGTKFAAQLQAKVTDASGVPVNNASVTFSAPNNNPPTASLTFSTGGTSALASTNSAGIAISPVMTANAVPGSYNVNATVGNLITPASFPMTNAPNTGPHPALSVTSANVGKDLETGITVSLPATAGAGGVVVTLASGDASKLLIAPTGKTSVQITIPQGETQVNTVVQGLVTSGTVTVTATATGYTNGTATVTLFPSGFVLAGPNDIGISFQTYSLLPTSLTVYSARLDATGKYVEKQQLRASLPAPVSVSVNSTSAGSVSPSPVTFNPANSSQTTTFKALSTGTATITVPAPAGFSAVVGGANTVVATILPSGMVLPTNVTLGQNLETSANIMLNGAVGPAGATLTLTSADSTRLKFSATPTGAGQGTINLTLPGGAHSSPIFYIQGFGSSGSVGYTAEATGFGSANGSVALAPSGIVFTTLFGGPPNPVLAGAGGSPVTVTVYSAILNSAGDWVQTQAVAGGLSPTVTITSSNTSVGTMNPAQVTIPAGQATGTTQFHPGAAGTSNLTVSVPGSPSGFSKPSATYNTIVATVTVSKIVLASSGNGLSIGKDLQIQDTAILGQAAPAGGLTVTLSVTSGSLLLAKTATGAGTSSIALAFAAGQTTANFYVQSTGSSGTASYQATAPGYQTGSSTVTLTNSGVVMADAVSGLPFSSVNAGSSTAITVNMAQLDPTTNAYVQAQQLRGGMSLSITINSGNSGIVTVNSPVTISGGADPTKITTLVHGIAAGTAAITAVQPPGYTAATNNVGAFNPMPSINITVN